MLGAIPMAVAQASPNADLILAQSITGRSAALNYPAPAFTLTGQLGRPVSLTSLRGKTVLLAFSDPGCTVSCAPIAAEFASTARLLGPSARDVTFVTVGALAAQADGQAGVELTGSTAKLRQVWRRYDVDAGSQAEPDGTVYLIDPTGQVRGRYRIGSGPGSAATISSFAVLFRNAIKAAS
jgi:cytochrome oxidase Cu insertion factor (SCO1/SenC/PrrC family)